MFQYKLDSLIGFLQQNQQYKSIVLQFPNDQLAQAIRIKRELETVVKVKYYLLSDHLHSDCCVDIVGALHVQCDLLVHFGEACFSEGRESNLPIYFVLPSKDLTKRIPLEQLDQNERYWFLNDQVYNDEVQKFVNGPEFGKINLTQLLSFNLIGVQFNEYENVGLGYYLKKCDKDQLNKSLFFIGDKQSILLERFVQQFEFGFFNKILVWNDQELEEVSNHQMQQIMSRQKQIDEAKVNIREHQLTFSSECRMFWIIDKQSECQLHQEGFKAVLGSIVRSKQEVFYFLHEQTLFFQNIKNIQDSLNEAKLGNFSEIQAYVIISCYRNSIIDTKKYFKLVITPFQLQESLTNKTKYAIESDLAQFNYQNQTQNDKPPECFEIMQIIQLFPTFYRAQKIELANVFSTLDHYQGRTYQGIEQRPGYQFFILQIHLFRYASIDRKIGVIGYSKQL